MKILIPWTTSGSGNIIIETADESGLEFLNDVVPSPMPGFGNQTFIAANSVVFITNHALSIGSDALTPVDRTQTLTFVTTEGSPTVTRTLTVTQAAATLPNYKVNIKDLNTLTEQLVPTFDFQTSGIQPSEVIQFDRRNNPIDLSGWDISLIDKYGNTLATVQSTSTGIVPFNSVEILGPYVISIEKNNESHTFRNVVFDANNEFNIYLNFEGSSDF